MRYFTALIMLFSQLNAYTQLKAEEVLDSLDRSYTIEKIHLHYNKDFYFAGETIYFKSYVFNGYELSSLSTNLFVVLYDKEKNIIDKDIVPLVNGIGEGSLHFKSDVPEGVYYVKAYTQWMLNFDPSFLYTFSLPVYNPSSPEKLVEKPVHWTASAFSESRRLRAGIENTVAVRLFAKGSLPKQWSGYVTTLADTSTRLLHFQSLSPEIASFRFIPQPHNSYRVVVFDNQQKQVINLPLPEDKGVVLQTKQTDSNVVCTIYLNNALNRNAYKLVAQMQHQMVYLNRFKHSKEQIVLNIPKNKLVNGILHVTLFDGTEKPIAERLVFVQSSRSENIAVRFDTISIQKHALNHWNIEADTNATFYTAVVTDTSISAQHNILSTIYLTSDFGNNITHPSYYLPATNERKAAALDALLITEEWKRFNWRKILTGIFPSKTYNSDRYLSFIGSVFQGRRMQNNKEVVLFIPVNKQSTITRTVKTDSTGAFVVDGLLFTDTTTVYYQLNERKNSAKTIKIFFEPNTKFVRTSFPFPYSTWTLAARQQGEELTGIVQRSWRTLQTQWKVDNRYKELDMLTVRSRQRGLREKLNQQLSSPAFQSPDEDIYDFVNNTRIINGANNIIDWLRGRVPGINIVNSANGINLTRLNQSLSLFLNEIPTPALEISQIPIRDIAMVKFQRSPQFYSANNNGGSILVYTKRGDMANSDFFGLPNAKLVGYKTYTPPNSFDYDNISTQYITYDQRPILAWQTAWDDGLNSLPIRFYHNDNGGVMKLIISGVNRKGEIFYQEQMIETDRVKPTQKL